ncbi:hypothetical protein PITCH_A2070003 [uncultured Desulfobacterium sp.]|uniref:Uncharacterized protein n=1 Tax=uncultured Desulfobacterium sp. TaxID=201089 RepID=A0A445MXE6_9BACT|nr:hypothetical protein PITCH_A2070003 [uncultured Desulfobacterium sp.]
MGAPLGRNVSLYLTLASSDKSIDPLATVSVKNEDCATSRMRLISGSVSTKYILQTGINLLIYRMELFNAF